MSRDGRQGNLFTVTSAVSASGAISVDYTTQTRTQLLWPFFVVIVVLKFLNGQLAVQG